MNNALFSSDGLQVNARCNNASLQACYEFIKLIMTDQNPVFTFELLNDAVQVAISPQLEYGLLDEITVQQHFSNLSLVVQTKSVSGGLYSGVCYAINITEDPLTADYYRFDIEPTPYFLYPGWNTISYNCSQCQLRFVSYCHFTLGVESYFDLVLSQSERDITTVHDNIQYSFYIAYSSAGVLALFILSLTVYYMKRCARSTVPRRNRRVKRPVRIDLSLPEDPLQSILPYDSPVLSVAKQNIIIPSTIPSAKQSPLVQSPLAQRSFTQKSNIQSQNNYFVQEIQRSPLQKSVQPSPLQRSAQINTKPSYHLNIQESKSSVRSFLVQKSADRKTISVRMSFKSHKSTHSSELIESYKSVHMEPNLGVETNKLLEIDQEIEASSTEEISVIDLSEQPENMHKKVPKRRAHNDAQLGTKQVASNVIKVNIARMKNALQNQYKPKPVK
ncbi:Hypothetical_protein [Hexamita inflata]|uniref:Hypothetical_protein n=1 Tax=Hexamita inflata TaxID=28002 RepID=A0AA86PC79_9EUKA|nr:Hypothetical protein HINF_LOCUS20797 [Hexamita inflata]